MNIYISIVGFFQLMALAFVVTSVVVAALLIDRMCLAWAVIHDGKLMLKS